MMFEYDLTTPSETSKANAVERLIKLPKGVVTDVFIQFPTGCMGLAHFRATIAGHGLWPRNFTGSIKSNGFIIHINEHFKLKHGWNTIRVLTWNLDDAFDHTITLRIIVLDEEVVTPVKVFEKLQLSLDIFLRAVGIIT